MSAPVSRAGLIRFAAFLVGMAAMLGITLWLGPPDVQALHDAVARFGVAGPIVAVLGTCAAIVALVPRTVLSIALGVMFGWLPGFVYLSIGCLIGATIGFAIGRVLGREVVADRLARWSRPVDTGSRRLLPRLWRRGERGLAVADAWLARHGVVGMWIARIIPMAHYGFLSYACGTASIRFRHYLIGTAIGSIPGALGYTAVGGAVLASGGVPLAIGLATLFNVLSVATLLLLRRRFGRPEDLPSDPPEEPVAGPGASERIPQ